jgi:hypothetical protein
LFKECLVIEAHEDVVEKSHDVSMITKFPDDLGTHSQKGSQVIRDRHMETNINERL